MSTLHSPTSSFDFTSMTNHSSDILAPVPHTFTPTGAEWGCWKLVKFEPRNRNASEVYPDHVLSYVNQKTSEQWVAHDIPEAINMLGGGYTGSYQTRSEAAVESNTPLGELRTSSMLPFLESSHNRTAALLPGHLHDNSCLEGHGGDSGGDTGADYRSPPRIQESMQPLFFSSNGYAGHCSDSSTTISASGTPNMVLMSSADPGDHNVGLMQNDPMQNHLLNVALPPGTIAHSPLSAQRAAMASPGYDNASLLTHAGMGSRGMEFRASSSGAWRNGGAPSEMLFIPMNEHPTQYMYPQGGYQESEHLAGYTLRPSDSVSSFQGNAHTFFPTGDGQPHSPIRNWQQGGLALSLSSSQQPLQAALETRYVNADIDTQEARARGNYHGEAIRFRACREDYYGELNNYGPGANYGQNPVVPIGRLQYPGPDPTASVMVGAKFSGFLRSSNYLTAMLGVLQEVCSLVTCTKGKNSRCSRDDQPGDARPWENHTHNGILNSTQMQQARDFTPSEAVRRDYSMSDATIPLASAIVFPQQHLYDIPPPTLAPGSREELIWKKTRLSTLIGEVDRRYKVYGEQLTFIVRIFNSLALPDSALQYTTLARDAMSSHFRCLKDTINVQIRVARRVLGDNDANGYVAGARLRLADAHLRQQRTLQHLGVIQQAQNAWRPQRGLPERAVTILRAWLFEHFLHPYPKDSDKMFLAKQTGLTRSQVSNWFINARVRLWKPMVEEMYLDEFSAESEVTGNNSNHSAARTPSSEHDELMSNQDIIGQRSPSINGYNSETGGSIINENRQGLLSVNSQNRCKDKQRMTPAAPATEQVTMSHASNLGGLSPNLSGSSSVRLDLGSSHQVQFERGGHWNHGISNKRARNCRPASQDSGSGTTTNGDTEIITADKTSGESAVTSQTRVIDNNHRNITLDEYSAMRNEEVPNVAGFGAHAFCNASSSLHRTGP